METLSTSTGWMEKVSRVKTRRKSSIHRIRDRKARGGDQGENEASWMKIVAWATKTATERPPLTTGDGGMIVEAGEGRWTKRKEVAALAEHAKPHRD